MLHHHDAELARIEKRSAALTRQMAALERDCAELAERRAAEPEAASKAGGVAQPTSSAFS